MTTHRASRGPVLTNGRLLLAFGLVLLFASGCHPGEEGSGAPPDSRPGLTEAAGPGVTDDPRGDDRSAEPGRLTIGELRQLIDSDDQAVVLVDVRSPDSYQRRHARGAVSVPLAEISSRARDELPMGPLLVTYCT
jgi:hypothetical protein